jgi:hypothetical protein
MFGSFEEVFYSGRFLGRFEKHVVDIACPFAISILTFLSGFWNVVCRIQFLLRYPVEGHDSP